MELKPDEEYPDWVWSLHIPLPTLDELQQKYDADPESLSDEEKRRMIKQWNRARIKEENDAKRK